MLVLDRFEGEYAVCELEDGTFLHIARHLIAPSAQEGDALDSWETMFVPNTEKTAATKQRIRTKVNALFSRNHD